MRGAPIVVACVVVVVVGIAGPARAGDDKDDDADADLSGLSLEELMNVRVRTASFVLDKRDEQPVSMTTITRDDIDESGARTLNELLDLYVPGFFLVEDQDDVIAGFRGFAPDNNSKVLLLVDGRPVETEWFGGPPDAILNGIDLGWIDRVEVIRGPGSVTYGQGALLGVINVITRGNVHGSLARVETVAGTGRLLGVRVAAGMVSGDTSATLYLSGLQFAGAPLRDEGWAATEENPPGVTVFDRGHHLKAADQHVALGTVKWRDLSLQVLDVDQWRDNYDFYRDREAIEERLLAVTLDGKTTLREHLDLEARAGVDRDDFGELALDGTSLAGTREDRQSALVVARYADEDTGDRAALGVEGKRIDMGLDDQRGQNLIVDDKASRPFADNAAYTWVRPSIAYAGAVFAEYAHRFSERVSAYAGARFDAHRFWGTAWSPRLGALARVTPALDVRAGIQSGFRGAVGVHYVGGFEHDGLLSAANFDKVTDNPLLASMGFTNVPGTQPERMYSAELAARYHAGELTVEGVAFLDRMRDMIEAGVIYVGPSIANAPADERRIGTDVVGDWGGWFFFKNDPGAITSGGAELSADWRSTWVDARASYSLARVLSLDSGAEVGSIYVSGSAADPHFRAYPENVARLHVRAKPTEDTWIALGGMWFGHWYTPAGGGGVADGAGHAWIDLSAGATWRQLSVIATVKNLTDTGGLWPMNSNAADPSISPGTPALEGRSLWVTVRASLP